MIYLPTSREWIYFMNWLFIPLHISSMPNIVINEIIDWHLSSISLEKFSEILSVLKNKNIKSVSITGSDPLLHEEILKFTHLTHRVGFKTTICLPKNSTFCPIQVVKMVDCIELDWISILNATNQRDIIRNASSLGKDIILNISISYWEDYQWCFEYAKASWISKIRINPKNAKYWSTPEIQTNTREYGRMIYQLINSHSESFQFLLWCGISKDIFWKTEYEQICNTWIIHHGGCRDYPGEYTINSDWSIFKCNSLVDLYRGNWLNIDNFESDIDLYKSIEVDISEDICISHKPIPERPEKPYDRYPSFYEEDNRKHRAYLKWSKEHLEKKNSVALPKELIQGKSILDLWSCLWAMGQWALFYGASSYTGVEVQAEYAEKSRHLLSHHWDKVKIIQSSIEDFLKRNTEKYDIIVCLGVLYVFVDYYSILKELSEITLDHMILESFEPLLHMASYDISCVQFTERQGINLSTEASSLFWRGTKITPKGLEFIMEWFWFGSNDGVIRPTKIYQWIDGYRDTKAFGRWRYMMRFYRKWNQALSLSEKLIAGSRDITKEHSTCIEKTQWKFDERIATTFQYHAMRHIQDYIKVIDLCIYIIKKNKDIQSRILEFWSALWYTLDMLHKEWYTQSIWLEKSRPMLDNSLRKEHVHLWEHLTNKDGLFSVIISNWTLHFIKERREYLKSFFEHMEQGGILFITDKVTSSELAHDLYIDFKKMSGLTEDEIRAKTESLKWYIHPFDVTWYYKNTREIWFKSIDIIHATPAFVTFMIIK